jgi:mRNA-degrading endonuclease RelE of RelBE toxin-antitoxin system
LKTPLQLSGQVEEFLKTQPPAPRQKLRRALRDLEEGKGDIQPLREDLAGYCRLRVGDIRVIFRVSNDRTGPKCLCSFAERRDLVYEQFAAILSEQGRL